LKLAPKLAVGDGALGFWGALAEVFPDPREQRCWVHKSTNVLNYLPKAAQPKAKSMLHEIWMAQTRVKELQQRFYSFHILDTRGHGFKQRSR